MVYLIVFQVTQTGDKFLALHKNGSIRAFKSASELLDTFEPYIRKFAGNREEQTSTTLGMVAVDPIAISFPGEAEELSTFLLETKPVNCTGQFGEFVGVKVSEDILKFQEFRIWTETMKRAGIM